MGKLAHTKTGFAFSNNQNLIARQNDEVGQAVIPGLETAEDFPRTKGAKDFTRTTFQ